MPSEDQLLAIDSTEFGKPTAEMKENEGSATTRTSSREKMDELFNYRITPKDLHDFRASADTLYDSDLVDATALKGLRVVTFDSTHWYIVTQGNHVSTDQCIVEEMLIEGDNPHGFRLFKIDHKRAEGQTEKSYRGACALPWDGELVQTVTDTENLVIDPYDSEKKTLAFKAIKTAPQSQFDRINQQRFDYLTDVIFHEAGHIEDLSGMDPETLPSQSRIDEFWVMIRKTSRISVPVINLLAKNLDKETCLEVYAMTIDREARRVLQPESLSLRLSQNRIVSTLEKLQELTENAPLADEETVLNWSHAKAEVLVYALEEVLPDYTERKRWLQQRLRTA